MSQCHGLHVTPGCHMLSTSSLLVNIEFVFVFDCDLLHNTESAYTCTSYVAYVTLRGFRRIGF